MMQISRRTFCQAAATSVAAAPLVRAQALPDVVVVGAGAFGGWAALHLREMGAAVTLVDAYGPGNGRASSGGETRLIRAGYGAQELYSRWVLKAFEQWKAREQEWGQTLLTTTGRLQLATKLTEDIRAQQQVFQKLGVKSELIPHEELRRRYPQIRLEGVEFGFLEPGAGVLKARFAMQKVAEAFARKGGRLSIARAEPPATGRGSLERLSLGASGSVSAAAYVFACGPWLPKLFPSRLRKKIFTPRRDVFFFGTPAGDTRFDHPNMPSYQEEGYYGFPNLESRGFKVCPTGEMVAFDPDLDERVASGYQLQRSRRYLARRFPALANQPLVESRVCQTEVSVDDHFIVQKHPDWSNVWIAGAGSGHGFKHGPVVGEYVARRASGKNEEPEIEAMFRIKPETFPDSYFPGNRS